MMRSSDELNGKEDQKMKAIKLSEKAIETFFNKCKNI